MRKILNCGFFTGWFRGLVHFHHCRKRGCLQGTAEGVGSCTYWFEVIVRKEEKAGEEDWEGERERMEQERERETRSA